MGLKIHPKHLALKSGNAYKFQPAGYEENLEDLLNANRHFWIRYLIIPTVGFKYRHSRISYDLFTVII